MKHLLVFFFIAASLRAFGQPVAADTLRTDSLEVDTLDVETDSLKIGSQTKLQDGIRKFAGKDNLISRLLKGIVSEAPDAKANGWDYSDSEFDKYEGKIINEIRIVDLNVFGATIDDTSREAKSWVQRTGNALHIQTRDWIVKNQLLFRTGERFDPFVAAESERILRGKEYVYDAKIIVEPSPNDPDSVNIVALVKDVWSIKPDGSYDVMSDKGHLTFEDANFLGYGMTFETSLKKNKSYGRNWTVDGRIAIDNLFHHYLRAEVYKRSDFLTNYYGISFGREFISPLFNWAGGVELNRANNYFRAAENVDSLLFYKEKYLHQDYWLGYGTDFSKLLDREGMQNEYYLAGRFRQIDYFEKPEIETDNFENNYMTLFSAGYSFRRYHKTRYVSHLGKLEDIPHGSLATLTLGARKWHSRMETYAGIKWGYSFYRQRFGYMSAFLDAGSYFDEGKSTLGAASVSLFYFTPMMKAGKLRVRNFLRVRTGYIHSPYRFEHLINLRDRGEVRGFPSETTGNKKLTINYEANFYAPVKVIGFNFALVTFADFVWLGMEDESLLKGGFYPGFGGGIRFRNEALIFPSVQLLFGFYPNGSSDRLRFFSQPRDFYFPDRLDFTRPEAVIE